MDLLSETYTNNIHAIYIPRAALHKLGFWGLFSDSCFLTPVFISVCV